jgi:hypothetical protein
VDPVDQDPDSDPDLQHWFARDVIKREIAEEDNKWRCRHYSVPDCNGLVYRSRSGAADP